MNPTLSPNPFAATADPLDTLTFCERCISAENWFATAGIPEHWPLTTDEAADLLRVGGEYDVSRGDLVDLIGRKLLAAPGIGENGYEWNAQDLTLAAGSLESRNQWLPTPSKNDVKKHPSRLGLELARAAGTLADVAHGGPVRFDVRHLFALLVACDSYEGRIKIAALLEAVLEVDHGVPF